MAKSPTSVTIRSYQVGFGDCFLLQFHYAGGDVRNVLIDFGTTGVPKTMEMTPSKLMPIVAEKVAEHCGCDVEAGKEGKLHVVVATHRHKDHISGFATDGSNGGSGKIIAALRPDVVIQPWTEDPNAAENATRATSRVQGKRVAAFQSGLGAMHDVAKAAVAFADAELGKAASRRPAAMSQRSLDKLRFVGEDNVKNLSAVQNLIDMGRRRGAKRVYANYGMDLGTVLKRVLPGVDVTVLGPPNLEQTDGIRTMKSRDKNEFWQLLSGPPGSRRMLPLAKGVGGAKTEVKGGAGAAKPEPQVRWFARRLTALRAKQVLEIVTALDEEMNNTSLILLFEFGGRKLLFPGDAQLENWRFALQEVGKGKEAAENVERLADTDLYKVGHHGSLNATPKNMLWKHLSRRKRPASERLRTMMSTMPGKHPGKVGGIGEVPRKPLVAALEAETVLFNTDRLKKSKNSENAEWFHTVTIDAR